MAPGEVKFELNILACMLPSVFIFEKVAFAQSRQVTHSLLNAIPNFSSCIISLHVGGSGGSILVWYIQLKIGFRCFVWIKSPCSEYIFKYGELCKQCLKWIFTQSLWDAQWGYSISKWIRDQQRQAFIWAHKPLFMTTQTVPFTYSLRGRWAVKARHLQASVCWPHL